MIAHIGLALIVLSIGLSVFGPQIVKLARSLAKDPTP